MRIAVLDLGSTSFHVLVVDVDEHLRVRRVLRRRDTLHLAATIAQSGHLPPEAIAGARRAARALRRVANRTGPDVIVAAATHALREAANGDHLLEYLSEEIRCPIRLLDGSTEARLVYEGVRRSVSWGDAPMLVCDLGGGSLELAAGIGPQVLWDASYQLGASLLSARLVQSDPMRAEERAAIADLVHGQLDRAASELYDSFPHVPCFAAGGTARLLARLELARWGSPPPRDGLLQSGVLIPAGRLTSFARTLAGMSRIERLTLPGMPQRRVDTLPTGAIVLAALCESLELAGLIVTEYGLREGLILEAARVQFASSARAS